MSVRGPRLDSLGDCARFMGRICRELYTGKLDGGKAGRLAYCVNVLKSCLEKSDLEAQVEELKRRVGEIGGGG